MFCFSKTCRICKHSTNSFTLTCNIQKEVSNLFFSMFPELMNSELNRFLKNLCVPCVKQLMSFENFKKHCRESDQHYRRYLNQLKGHDGTHGELECYLGIKQENWGNDDIQIQPTFDNNCVQEASSYYGSAAHCSSPVEDFPIDIVKQEIISSNIKKENQIALVEEAISRLDCEESGSEEIRGPLTFSNQELSASDYLRSIDEENVNENENDIDGIQETINIDTVGLSSNSRNEDSNLKIIDSPFNETLENDYIQPEYYHGKDDFSSIAEDNITEIDIVKHEVCIADKDGSCDSIDSSVNDNENQNIAGKKLYFNHPEINRSCMVENKKTHIDEKPFECDKCKKRFSQKSYVMLHERIHTGEKPYKCNICKMSFQQKYTLTIHKRTHTNEKLYECDICKKRFSQKSYVKLHKRGFHGNLM